MPLDRPDDQAGCRVRYAPWAGLVALLVVEVVAMTLRFDREILDDRDGWVAVVITRSHWLASFGISASTLIGLVLFGSVQDDREWRRSSPPTRRSRRAWAFLLGHLVAYGCLVWLTGSLFEGTALTSAPELWSALWLVAGLTTLFFWMLVALPLGGWERLVRSHWKPGLVATLAGMAALILGQWTSSLWEWFHGSTFRAVRGVMSPFYDNLVDLPEEYVLGTPRFTVTISPQCSGFEGIGLIWVFLAVSLWWFRRELRFPQAFLLFPLGMVLSWVFNVLRIASLIALGDWGWEAMAAGGFHSQAGWLSFNGIALGLVVLARRASLFSRRAVVEKDELGSTENPTAAYVAPLLAIALTSMITGAFSEGGFDRLYGARVLTATGVIWYFRHQYGALRESCSWQAIAVGVAVFAMWSALEPAPPSSGAGEATSEALARMPRSWAWLVARSIGSVIVVPFAEELAFRGYLTRQMIAADFLAVPEGRFTWPSFLISSLLFGALHQRWLAGTVAGMAYALAYYRRGKLVDAIAAHAMTNLLITISVLATGEWSRWS